MNTQKATENNSAGYIRKILAHIKAKILLRCNRLAVTKKPLVIKNTSTAIEPNVIPNEVYKGSADECPIDKAKLWLNITKVAAKNRNKLKLLSLPTV